MNDVYNGSHVSKFAFILKKTAAHKMDVGNTSNSFIL